MELSKRRQERAEFLFRKADLFELALCQKMNRLGHLRAIRLFFKGISRLGDGVFWYTLGFCLAVISGLEGVLVIAHIATAGLLCVLIYSQLKNRLVRQRPFISFPDILAHTAPLDKYSFPSGHTMNAVNFAILFSWYFPALIWVVVPFAVLVGASRVILGMHYPTDVLVGALLGIAISYSSILLWPAGMYANLF
ncbi:MAG: phosphatase PAP2 family protein [Oceanospirillaceae bacterium]|nr:phosphatase PAP2 family protein [Oceanospirillaceae bacterium]|tara:strand:- start:878 stop:1459 length:582 start_codon:yes stop_codon:yes gene_type:complete